MSDILLIIAADTEWQAVHRLLHAENGLALAPGQSARVERWNGTVALRSGWGKVSSAAATQRAIDAHCPRMIVCLGTCGGIFGRARLGELVVVSRAIMHDVRPRMGEIEAERAHYTSDAEASLVASVARAGQLRPVTIGTGDRDLDEHEAAELAECGIDVVDWEAAAVAYVARRNHLPWLILKGVSDMVSSAGDPASLHEAYADGAEHVMRRLIEVFDRQIREQLPAEVQNTLRSC